MAQDMLCCPNTCNNGRRVTASLCVAAFSEQALYTTPWTNGNLVKVRRLDLKSQSRLGKEAG